LPNLTSQLVEYWTNETWVNIELDTYTYDLNGNLLTSKYQWWNNEVWNVSKRYTYTYDQNNNLLSEQYNNYTLKIYEYNNKNRTSYVKQMRSDDGWLNYFKVDYGYNILNNLTYEIYNEWKDSTWISYTKDSYAYGSESNIASILYQYMSSNTWGDIQKETYEYNAYGNLSSYNYAWWDGSNWNITNNDGSIRFTDSFNNQFEIYGSPIEISYKQITSTDINNSIINSFSLSQNYPNPFNPSTTISYSLEQNGFTQLKVYDMLGREVADLVNKEEAMGNYKVQFNAKNLSSGVYIYRLHASAGSATGFVESKKMLLIK